MTYNYMFNNVTRQNLYDYLVLLGLGDEDELIATEAEKAGGKLYAALETQKIMSAEL